MKRASRMLVFLVLMFFIGCTAVNTVHLAGRVSINGKDVLVTTGDIDRPHRSIGVIQLTRTGIWLFGFIELMPAQLDDAFHQTLAEEAVKYGADAVVNVMFYEIQYPLLLKILSVFTIVSPQCAMVTGELVEFTN